MEPIWQLLRSKVKSEDWTEAHRVCLRPVMVYRQYPQTRVMMCGWSSHNRCLCCLNSIVQAESPLNGAVVSPEAAAASKPKTVKDVVTATHEQILKAPKGDLIHRNWKCEHTEALRSEHAPLSDVRAMKDVDPKGHPTWERGLVARPTLPLKTRSKVETFNWHVKPDGPATGVVYTDGSARDGRISELQRCGWAFVVIDS